MKIKHYKQKQDEVKLNLDELKTKSNFISWARVGLFLLAVFAIFYGYFNENNLMYAIDLVVIALFLILVRYHSKLDEKLNYLESKYKVYKKYVRRLDGTWIKLKENGAEHLDDKNMHLKDLDIFGKGSLYQYICSANTIYGKKALASCLKNTDYDLEEIKKRQKAVEELSKLEDFSIDIETLAHMIDENKKKKADKKIISFIEACEQDRNPVGKLQKFLILTMPSLIIAFLVVALLGIKPLENMYMARTIFLTNILAAFLFFSKNTTRLSPVGDFNKNIKAYRAIFENIEKINFQSEYLIELKDILKEEGGALEAIDKLRKIGEYINTRNNFVGMLLFNGLFLWDFHCVDMLEEWKAKYGMKMRSYLEVVGEIEALISLANICYVRGDFAFAEISDSKEPILSFKDLKHPLIDQAEVVGNGISLASDTCIITGSNMSGKTTFLRSIGVNLVLAYAGGPVVAEEFSASIMKILTSIRVEDNVNKGISTFYAELLRIKEMTEYNKKKLPMICMIDEIFKGTNSADRIICATEAIKKLSNPHSITLVSTHDFELCSLKSEHKEVVNYHFSEYYENNEIKFDYRIKDGRCVTTNAKVLLKMTGIVDEIS